MNSRRNRWLWGAASLLGAAGLISAACLSWMVPPVPTGAELLAQAQAALRRREYPAATELAARIPPEDEHWVRGRLVAGEAALRSGHPDAALVCFAAVPRDGSKTGVLAAISYAEACRDLGRLSDAERAYSYVLEQQPNNTAAHERLAFLYGVAGRRSDALPHYLALLRSGTATLDELVLLGDLERPVDQGEYLEKCARNAPQDVLVQLGLAAHAASQGLVDEARPQLQAIVERAPELLAAHAVLGELLVDGDDADFVAWRARLPPEAERYADIWFVRGLWARRHGDLPAAARCFWETLRLNSVHRRATYQLGQVLIALGESTGAEFAQRSSQLFELTQRLDQVLRSQGQDQLAIRRVADLLEGMGRLWEAWGWAVVASEQAPQAVWPRRLIERVSKFLSQDLPRTADGANLALKYDLSKFPDDSRLLAAARRRTTSPPRSPAAATIRFVEADAGVDFTYFNAANPHTPGARMQEQTGGGVAVLDFDRDDWPDLYFTQGTEWPEGGRPTMSPQWTDCLFLNRGGAAFHDVTAAAGVVDRGFGQGCAAGDFDNDGFPDLYVANIGGNALLHNNGDGTFTDVTERCGLSGDHWTAGCLIADLNADGQPDLFDVNYLAGPDVFTRICNNHACSPKVFDGAGCRLFLGRGDGAFAESPDPTGGAVAKGLGVVAFDLDGRGRLSLFIACDQTPNLLLRNSGAAGPGDLRLENAAFAAGLAYNEDGLAMASMGVAADDANGDGLLDFFVTTFRDESRILYVQDGPGLFLDGANAAGLRAAGMSAVGWGAQFLDADLDGAPDIVTTNGHVDDYRSDGMDYQMRPQFFRNTGSGRFIEPPPAEVGAFFEQKRLGRGLARLDWNRDGRMDFVVSHIGDPAALVTNASSSVGRYLNVRLHARTTARDALGATVDVVAGERRWRKQLVGGDGYMAGNERMLQFGLGAAAQVTELRVRWPSGRVERVVDVPAEATVTLIEGAPRGYIERSGATVDVMAVDVP